MQHHEGFIPLHLDAAQEKLLLELPRDSVRALVFFSLATGLSRILGLVREIVAAQPAPISTVATRKLRRCFTVGANRAKWTANGNTVASVALSSM